MTLPHSARSRWQAERRASADWRSSLSFRMTGWVSSGTRVSVQNLVGWPSGPREALPVARGATLLEGIHRRPGHDGHAGARGKGNEGQRPDGGEIEPPQFLSGRLVKHDYRHGAGRPAFVQGEGEPGHP